MSDSVSDDSLSFHGTVERIIKNPVKNAHFDYDRCLAVMKKNADA